MEAVATPGCPKCGVPRTDAPSCPKCGLLAIRMEAFSRDLDAGVPADVRAAWKQVSDHWEDAAAHDALFALTVEHQQFAWTAARYREVGAPPASSSAPYRDKGEGKPGAAAYLERLRKGVEATLIVSATAARERRKKPYRSSMLVLGVLGFMILLGLFFASYMRSRRSSPTPQPNSAGSPAARPSQVR